MLVSRVQHTYICMCTMYHMHTYICTTYICMCTKVPNRYFLKLVLYIKNIHYIHYVGGVRVHVHVHYMYVHCTHYFILFNFEITTSMNFSECSLFDRP